MKVSATVTNNENVAADAAPVLHSSSVHKMSTYDLRQELERRKCMDIPDGQINHNSLLKRLIAELVKDEAKIVDEHTSEVVDKAQAARDEAKALREQRKREALERSQARQADPNYFKQRQENNEESEKRKTEQATAANASTNVEEEEEEEEANLDPFRSYKTKSRAKVAGFL